MAVGGLNPHPADGPTSLVLLDSRSNRTEHKLWTLTPTPLKKNDIQFQGIEASVFKNHWGIILLGKIMILEKIGHPISCLRTPPPQTHTCA